MDSARIGVVIHTSLRQTLFTPQDVARLDGLGEVVWTDSEVPITVAQACELLAGCEIGLGSWGTPYPCAELMAACPGLRLWEHVAGTVKHMFGPHLSGTDLVIASCKTSIADNVAEMTLGEIILGVRRAFQNAAANRTGVAGKPDGLKMLWAVTVGVVGASEVGRRVVRLLGAFPCTVLLYDPYVDEDEAASLGTELVGDLTDLCARSDVVTLHTPALPSTAGIIGRRELRAMPEDAVFINTARGMCVDEAALIEELEAGRLFAFLDVTDPEPAAAASPLRRLPNVVLTSHIAGAAGDNMGAQAVDDVAAFLRGDSPACIVRADELDRLA